MVAFALNMPFDEVLDTGISRIGPSGLTVGSLTLIATADITTSDNSYSILRTIIILSYFVLPRGFQLSPRTWSTHLRVVATSRRVLRYSRA